MKCKRCKSDNIKFIYPSVQQYYLILDCLDCKHSWYCDTREEICERKR